MASVLPSWLWFWGCSIATLYADSSSFLVKKCHQDPALATQASSEARDYLAARGSLGVMGSSRVGEQHEYGLNPAPRGEVSLGVGPEFSKISGWSPDRKGWG